MKTTLALLTASALALLACDSNPGETLSLVGKTPAAQAEAVSKKVCQHAAQCGSVEIECSPGMDGPSTCTGAIEAVDFDTCMEDRVPEGTAMLEACALTDEELRKIEACVNAMYGAPCITAAELDAYITALNDGDEPEPLGDEPAECTEIEDIFRNCEPAE